MRLVTDVRSPLTNRTSPGLTELAARRHYKSRTKLDYERRTERARGLCAAWTHAAHSVVTSPSRADVKKIAP